MANLLSTAELREHIETDLLDAALGRLNESADFRVIERAGPVASETESFIIFKPNDYPDGRDRVLTLERSPGVITSISEQLFDNTPVILSVDDYSVIGDQLERLNDGTNPRFYWGHRVIVVYAPVDNTTVRKGVIIDLVKLEVAYQGVASEKAGDYSMSAPEYLKAREAVLDALKPIFSFS